MEKKKSIRREKKERGRERERESKRDRRSDRHEMPRNIQKATIATPKIEQPGQDTVISRQ